MCDGAEQICTNPYNQCQHRLMFDVQPMLWWSSYDVTTPVSSNGGWEQLLFHYKRILLLTIGLCFGRIGLVVESYYFEWNVSMYITYMTYMNVKTQNSKTK